MNKLSILTTFLLLLFQGSADAQTRFLDKIYADANVGAFVLSNDNNTQLQVGLGYRINERHGVGLSYRRENGGNVYSGESIRGIGANYRFAGGSGIIFKAGVGKVLSAGAGEDNAYQYVFRSSGPYTNFSLAYQFRIGITLGFYLTQSSDLTFESYLPASDVDPFPFNDDSLVYQGDVNRPFLSAGITVGVALPWRWRGLVRRGN